MMQSMKKKKTSEKKLLVLAEKLAETNFSRKK